MLKNKILRNLLQQLHPHGHKPPNLLNNPQEPHNQHQIQYDNNIKYDYSCKYDISPTFILYTF